MTVPTTAVLGFMVAVLDAHEEAHSAGANEGVFIPAALSERERWLPLLREVCAVGEGVLVDSLLMGEGADCGELEAEAPELLQWLRESLEEYNGLFPGADLRAEMQDGQLEIFGAVRYTSTNASQKAVREVFTAACSDLLRQSQLSILVFAQDPMDAETTNFVWRRLMQLGSVLSTPLNSTLAVVAGDGIIDFSVHTEGDPSLLYRMSESGLAVRQRAAVSAWSVQVLRRYTASQMPLTVFFLGAGASSGWGLPLGNDLRDAALARIMGTAVDLSTFDDIASDWYRQLRLNGLLSPSDRARGVESFVKNLTLEHVIEQEQFEENDVFSSTLREFRRTHGPIAQSIRGRPAVEIEADPLRRLLALQKRVVLVTVNFDQVIESRAQDLVQPIVNDDDFTGFPDLLARYSREGGKVPLLKLHGDISAPETIVANIRETRGGLSLLRQSALDVLIQTIAAQELHYWWYVGYSMRDVDLDSTWKSDRMAKFAERWVSPFIDANVTQFINDHRLQKWTRGEGAAQRHVTLTAEDFFRNLLPVARNW